MVWPTVTHHFDDRGAVMDIRSGYDKGSEVYGAKIIGTFCGEKHHSPLIHKMAFGHYNDRIPKPCPAFS